MAGESGDPKAGWLEAETHAMTVAAADFEEAGDDDVLHKVGADLAGGGVETSDAWRRAKMDELMARRSTTSRPGAPAPDPSRARARPASA